MPTLNYKHHNVLMPESPKTTYFWSRNIRLFLDTCLLLIFITSSFDTFLNLKISGFSIRSCNLLMILFSSVVFFMTIFSSKPLKFKLLGFWSFLIWTIFLILFIQNSIIIQRGIGYIIWLLIFFTFILSLAAYIEKTSHFEHILKLYLLSFNIVAIIGLLQLFLTFAGIEFYLSYYFQSGIPRIHAFSYEPSYFSTYLIIPWIFHFYLYFSNMNDLKKKVKNRFSILLLTGVLLLSFSRMGILFMLVALCIKLAQIILPAIRKLRIKKKEFYFIGFMSVGFFILIGIAIRFSKIFISVFEGLPFFSRYAHSASIRIDDLLDTWRIFENSPWTGYSLGGIAPAIARLNGYGSLTQEVVKEYEGMSILLEVLAASGIVGFLFFMIFLSKIIFSGRIMKKQILNCYANNLNNHLSCHRMLIIALIAQLLLLCLNQNILRNYLWIHVGMINLSFFIFKEPTETIRKIENV
jgi:hypothetical protein